MVARSSRRSGPARVLLRLPRDLHRALTREATRAGLSFNALCIRRLGAPAPPDGRAQPRAVVLARARAVFGDDLIGMVALGSWTRGEAADTSDIDVLIVLDPRTALTRDLYRRWDAAPLVFGGRTIDAHFVHLPRARSTPGAVWCEAAVDGVIWHDRDDRVARWLADVRRLIAEGRVVRAFAHGQPYWTGAA